MSPVTQTSRREADRHALAKSRRASASRSRDTCAPRAAGRRRIRLSIDPVRPEPMSGTLRRARDTRDTRDACGRGGRREPRRDRPAPKRPVDHPEPARRYA
ncbi:hypothetical protein M218_18380 [Burkholderia pseudomallei MSHR338]|nr:hypothetical protein M218_18380 [Burkholderia pseudomallei MSHR338]